MADANAASIPAHRLQAALPEWMALKWQHAAACATYVAAFCVLCYFPVSSPVTWQAIAQGHVTSTPESAHRLPFATGMRHANLSWASDWCAAKLFNYGGPELVAITHAALVVAVVMLWNLTFYWLSGSWWALPGAILVAIASMPACDGLSGSVVGSGLLAVVVAVLAITRQLEGDAVAIRRLGRWSHLALGCFFAAWTNLDVSVLWGLCIVVLLCGERLLWLVRRGALLGIARDRELHARVLLLEVTIVATLCNPDGIHWWSSLFWWPDSALGRALGGWSSPGIVSWYGLTFVGSWMVLVKVESRKRTSDSLGTLLPIVGSVLLATFSSTAFSAIPLLWCGVFARAKRAASPATDGRNVPRSGNGSSECGMRFAYSLVVVLLLWVGYNFSPLGHRSDGNRRSVRELLGPDMPSAASSYLAETAGDSVVLAPGRWSDYFLVTTGCRLAQVYDNGRVPSVATQDFNEILRGTTGWETLAEKYALSHIVAHKTQHARLVHTLRQGVDDWRVLYEDGLAVIACRN